MLVKLATDVVDVLDVDEDVYVVKLDVLDGPIPPKAK
jgi:hypothetical protein